MSTKELVPGINVAELLINRDRVLATTRQLLGELGTLDKQSRDARLGSVWRKLTECLSFDSGIEGGLSIERTIAAFTRRLDTDAWGTLMHASGLRTFMDNRTREAWSKVIRDRETPAFEAETIEGTFRALYEQRGSMVEQGVIDCFRKLSWNRKTNNPCLFGPKLIVEWFHSPYSSGTAHGFEALVDLERAMCVYDGKPEPDHRTGVWLAYRQGIEEQCFATEHMEVQWFKNGNAHVKFLRMDLVDKLNQVLGKHYPGALPASRK